MNTVIRGNLLIAACLLSITLVGCGLSSGTKDSLHGQPPVLNQELFGQAVHVPDEAELFSLSSEQIEALDQFLSRQDDDADLHWQLARFIDRYLSNFDYWGKTLTASQALQDQQGNCMSLAIVTAAFTRHLGLEHDFQLMRTPPIFERQSDLVLVSDHVRTRIYPSIDNPQEEDSGLRIRRVIVDYFPDRERVPSRRVASDEFLAMYYRNVASEKLVNDDLDGAFRFAEHASTISPDNASILNLLAVVHRRAGDQHTAEALFRHALAIHPNDINVLHNLHALLDQQGRTQEAEKLVGRLAQLPDQDPYPRLFLARQLASDGQFHRALRIYQSITDQKPYMHEAFWGIAIVHHKQGDHERAHQAMEQALELARAPRHQRLYSAKLHSLESGSSPDSMGEP